jgi:hypothetical protein
MALTVQDGKLVLRDGAIGTEQACCCKKCEGPCEDNEDCAPGCACVDGECAQSCVLDADCPEGQVCCQYLLPLESSPEEEVYTEPVCIDPPCCFCPSFHDTLNLEIAWPGLWEGEYTLNLVSDDCAPVWEYESEDVEVDPLSLVVCKGEFLQVRAGASPEVRGVKILEDDSRLIFVFGGGNAPAAVYAVTERDPVELPEEYMWCAEYAFTTNWPEGSVNFMEQAYPRTEFCTDPINTDVFQRTGGFFYLSSP